MTGALAGPCDQGAAATTIAAGTTHPRATLAATILGSSVAFIDGSVVNVALPVLGRDLGASAADLSWTINAYLLPLGALILLGGAAGDHFGRRRLFLIGLCLFTVASILCAAAPTLSWLLAGRAVQGLGAAILMPNSLAILGASFTGKAQGQAIGTWAAAGALMGALGPLAGGWLVDTAGWRTIFLVNVPIAMAAGYFAWNYVAESKDRKEGAPLDWTGAALATAGLALVTWTLTAAAEPTETIGTLATAGAFGLLLLGLFVFLEARKGDRAIMPLAMFQNITFVGLTLLTFFLYASLGGLIVLLPYLLIRVENYTAVAAGAAMLPLPILIGLASPLMGRLTGLYGGRLPLSVGSGVVGCGLLTFVRIDTGGIDYWSDILPGTIIIAIGLAASVAPLTTSVMASVDPDHTGLASGFNNAVARIAGLIATALLGFVFAQQDSADGFVQSCRVAAVAGAVLAGLAACCALMLIRPLPVPADRPA